MNKKEIKKEIPAFTSYQKFVVTVLALLQFTVLLNFSIISPLGDTMMKNLQINTAQFGMIVSCYAFAAGIGGIFIATFADRFDRKKLLLFLYTGFVAGTMACTFTHSYAVLLVARSITGLFGGVVGSVVFTIVSDLFVLNQRGRVMGVVQMSFAVSSVAGIPLGLLVANRWGWNATFMLLSGLSVIIYLIISFGMKPIREHLSSPPKENIFQRFRMVLTNKDYLVGFAFTLCITGGGLFLVFSAPFMINNTGVSSEILPVVFLLCGISTAVVMPFVGKLSDKISKRKIFVILSIVTMTMILVFTHLSVTPVWVTTLIFMLIYVGASSRTVPMGALNTAVPKFHDKGAYLSICASLQQLANGLGAMLAGFIIVQVSPTDALQNYNIVGYIVVALSSVAIVLIYRMEALVQKQNK